MIRACICLLLFAAVSPARAQDIVGLPCSAQQFEDALRARAPEVERAAVRVRPAERGFVVAVGSRAKRVDLAGAQGVEAARMLAMVVAELAPSEAQSEPDTSAPAAPVRAAGRSDRAYVSVDGSALHGVSRRDVWGVDAGVGGTFALTRHLLWLGRASYWWMRGAHTSLGPSLSPEPAFRFPDPGLRFDAISLRTGPGLRLWKLDLGLMALFTSYWVRNDASRLMGRPFVHRGLLGGASISASFWLPLSTHVRLGARAHCDVLGPRRHFIAGSSSVLETPSVAFGLGLGLAWGWT